MADWAGALVQLGTLAASLLAQKQQQGEKKKREDRELGIDAGRARQDAAADMLFARAREMGTPGASYLGTAARTNAAIGRGSEDLKRQQKYYEDDHATDYLNPQVLSTLGRSLSTSEPSAPSGPPEPRAQRVAEDIYTPATSSIGAASVAPSAAAAGVAGGANMELERILREYGYR